jgi:hypothetical protein
VGSTGRWPQVVNIWEENGFEGMAQSFSHEFGHRDLQDPKLAAWWAAAASLRAGGVDRLLRPAPWMLTIDQLCAGGVRGEVYAHEQIRVPRGTSARYLDFVQEALIPVMAEFGWVLGGAWETALIDDSECFLLWVVPTWTQWAEREKARQNSARLADVESHNLTVTEKFRRILLVDAELSPMRLGRQPARGDRTEEWSE